MADFTALKNSIRNYIKQNGNAEITGEVLQNILISMVVSMGDGAINGIADGLANEGNARTNADGLLQNAINSISTALGDGYTYAGIATPATTPTSGRVFYLALQAGTYTNFGGIVVTQGINILKNNDGTWQLDNVIGIDDIPTAGSPNLVKSGGAFANMGAFDISDYNKSGSTLATYADLTAALAALPSEYQKGGMSVKFIQSSDNNYVQYRLMNQSFTTDIKVWSFCGDDVLVENSEWIHVVTDSDDKILYGLKTDGNFYFGKGCPPQVQQYVQTQIDAIGIDALLATKVDKVVGKSLIDADFASSQSVIENIEFLEVKTDSEDKILYGVKTDGNFYFGKGCPQQIVSELNKKVDKEKGKGLIDAAVSTCLSVNENLEYTEATVDKDSKVVESRNINTGIKEERIGFQSPVVITDELVLTRKGIGNFSKTLQNLGIGVKGTEEYSESLTKALNMPIAHPINASGKELYSDINTYNVERKACRCRYLRWTSLFPIPMDIIGQDAYFNPGEMIGIPYSSAMEWDKMVGYDLSYITFLTAANNPYSMLYTENPRNNGSVYGFNYFQPARGTVAGWAGIVCNILCNYSTGMDIPYDTGMFKYLASVGKFVKVCPQNAQGVRIGDILWQDGHARLVQNVWRDSNGLVQKIEVSKGGWSSPEYMFNTPEEFDADLASRDGIIYRNAELCKNYEYTDIAFPVTPIVGEDYPEDAYSYTPDEPYEFNDDICTYAGDYACFREGYRIVLNYNLKNTNNNWQSVELYKDNVLYGTYLLSSDSGTYDRGPANYPAEAAALVPLHSFDLSFLNLTYGKYKARLTDGSGNYSDYTYFEIIDTEISYTIKHGVITIDFSTHNSIPHYVRISYPSGAPKCLYELTKEDIENGRCSFNFVELIEKQYNNLGIQGEILKVYFKGDYGTVTSSPINIKPYIHW